MTKIIEGVGRLNAHGGGDCPESAMAGIQVSHSVHFV